LCYRLRQSPSPLREELESYGLRLHNPKRSRTVRDFSDNPNTRYRDIH